MSVKIQDNSPLLKIKNQRAISLSLRMLVEDVDREAFRHTPKDRGELRKNLSKTVSGTSAKIRWGSRYAVFQERGYSSGPIRRYTTAGTGPHFAENAVRKVVKGYSSLYFRSMT